MRLIAGVKRDHPCSSIAGGNNREHLYVGMMDDGNVNEIPHDRRGAELAETTMWWRIYQTSALHIKRIWMHNENISERTRAESIDNIT